MIERMCSRLTCLYACVSMSLCLPACLGVYICLCVYMCLSVEILFGVPWKHVGVKRSSQRGGDVGGARQLITYAVTVVLRRHCHRSTFTSYSVIVLLSVCLCCLSVSLSVCMYVSVSVCMPCVYSLQCSECVAGLLFAKTLIETIDYIECKQQGEGDL